MSVLANAGADIIVNEASLPIAEIQLTGGASGGVPPYTYAWQLISVGGGSVATLNSAALQNPKILGHDTVSNIIAFLVVTDDTGATSEPDWRRAPIGSFCHVRTLTARCGLEYTTQREKSAPGSENGYVAAFRRLVAAVDKITNGLGTVFANVISPHTGAKVTVADVELEDGYINSPSFQTSAGQASVKGALNVVIGVASWFTVLGDWKTVWGLLGAPAAELDHAAGTLDLKGHVRDAGLRHKLISDSLLTDSTDERLFQADAADYSLALPASPAIGTVIDWEATFAFVGAGAVDGTHNLTLRARFGSIVGAIAGSGYFAGGEYISSQTIVRLRGSITISAADAAICVTRSESSHAGHPSLLSGSTGAGAALAYLPSLKFSAQWTSSLAGWGVRLIASNVKVRNRSALAPA